VENNPQWKEKKNTIGFPKYERTNTWPSNCKCGFMRVFVLVFACVYLTEALFTGAFATVYAHIVLHKKTKTLI